MNFYVSDNSLTRLVCTLRYLHDDAFLRNSKEFVQ